MDEDTVEPLPGSLHLQWVRCGKSWCRCVNGGPQHGPYYYRFYRVEGKQHKKYVPRRQVDQVRAAIRAWRALHPPIWSIEASLRQINRIFKILTREENYGGDQPRN